jgi:GntR family transcriptional repressor for pyruvate dehydrogenase complex
LSLSRVRRSKLAETVAQQLLREIRVKQLARGTKMPPERELMAQLHVGRSTVREAMNGLAMLGVLDIRHGQGVYVADPAAGSGLPRALTIALRRGVTRDLFEARRRVEVETARLAAQRRTEADLRDISRALRDHEHAIADGAPAVGPSVRFHLCIADAAHSEVLAGFVHSFQEPFTERGRILEAEPEQHRGVFEPIKAGDAAGAVERMRAHLEAVVPYHDRIGLP